MLDRSEHQEKIANRMSLKSATRKDGMDIAQVVNWAEEPNHVIQDHEKSVRLTALINPRCPERVLAIALNDVATPRGDQDLLKHIIDHANVPKDLVLDFCQKKRMQLTHQIKLCHIPS